MSNGGIHYDTNYTTLDDVLLDLAQRNKRMQPSVIVR
jgi:hypothetical protein